MIVHPVGARQQLLEVVEPNVEGDAHTDGRPEGVATWPKLILNKCSARSDGNVNSCLS